MAIEWFVDLESMRLGASKRTVCFTQRRWDAVNGCTLLRSRRLRVDPENLDQVHFLLKKNEGMLADGALEALADLLGLNYNATTMGGNLAVAQ